MDAVTLDIRQLKVDEAQAIRDLQRQQNLLDANAGASLASRAILANQVEEARIALERIWLKQESMVSAKTLTDA